MYLHFGWQIKLKFIKHFVNKKFYVKARSWPGACSGKKDIYFDKLWFLGPNKFSFILGLKLNFKSLSTLWVKFA